MATALTLLDRDDVQAVVVATPTHLHRAIAIDALEAGKHVYCEAPLAASIDDARAIPQAARGASTVFQTGLQGRSNPIYKLAPNPELGRLMLSMLYNEGNRAARTKQVASHMRQWAGDSQERRAALAKYCKAVVSGDFELNEYARKELKQLAADPGGSSPPERGK